MTLIKLEGVYLCGWRARLLVAGLISILSHWVLFECLAVQGGAAQSYPVNTGERLTVNLQNGRFLMQNKSRRKESAATPQTSGGSPDKSLLIEPVSTEFGQSLMHWSEPYLPSSLVDVRPRAREGIVIPFPSIPLGVPKAGLILVLYIGQDGKVDRVEVESSQVPEEFEQVVRSTFLMAEFEPASRGGRKVRGQLRIEAEFMEP